MRWKRRGRDGEARARYRTNDVLIVSDRLAQSASTVRSCVCVCVDGCVREFAGHKCLHDNQHRYHHEFILDTNGQVDESHFIQEKINARCHSDS